MKKKLLSNNRLLNSNWFWSGVIFLAMMGVYLLLIQLWNVTSSEYKPVGLTDNVSRAPESIDDWFIRRERGVCPFDFREFDVRHPFRGFEDC